MRPIVLIILLISVISVKGQNLFNQGTIYISPTGLLYVNGDIVNNNLIVNNGDMQVSGAWTNNAQYDAGTGKITFNSNLPQTINHNAQSFSRLTSSGGGIKNFPANIIIIDELKLEDGTLVSQNDATITFSSGAQIIGGSDQSHINGPVYQQGTGNKLFPVGNGTQYLPVEILGIGSSSEVGIRLVEFTSPQSFGFNSELADVSGKRYWELDLVDGSLTGTQLSLPIKGDEGLSAPTSQYAIVQSPDSPIEFASLGQFSFTGNEADGKVISTAAPSTKLVSVGTLSEGIVVYNAISANGDTQNAKMKIGNITLYPNNIVSIFNRWGDKVFEMKGYNNADKVFIGTANVGANGDLPAGTYFYKIDKGDGSALVNGFLSLKK